MALFGTNAFVTLSGSSYTCKCVECLEGSVLPNTIIEDFFSPFF